MQYRHNPLKVDSSGSTENLPTSDNDVDSNRSISHCPYNFLLLRTEGLQPVRMSRGSTVYTLTYCTAYTLPAVKATSSIRM